MIKKIALLLTMFLLILSFVNIKINVVRADTTKSFGDVVDEASDWVENGKNKFSSLGINTADITSPIKTIAQALTTIGVGIILVAAAVLGIKWLTANAEEQAKLKQQTVGLVVAAVVVLGAYTIWTVAVKIASSF